MSYEEVLVMDYKLYQSKYIVEHQSDIISQCHDAKKFYMGLPSRNATGDMTADYFNYNIFSLTAGSYPLYEVYKELVSFVKSQLGEQRMWMQSWLNYHDHDKVLGWHNHDWDYHGYISIDPKNTVTEFRDYKIENKVGQIYFGPGKREHRVVCLDEFSDTRLTIGFDIAIDLFPGNGCLGMLPVV
jgi:hypothetical protein